MRKVATFAEFARQVTCFVDVAADYESDFVLLPELFSVQLLSRLDAISPHEGMKKLADHTPRFKKLMSDLARKCGLTIIAGSRPVLTGRNVGNLSDVANMDVQYGHAAVFTPSDFAFARDGIAAEADSNEETVLICDLDLDSLSASRSAGTVTPRLDRRPDLFQFVSAFRAPAPSADSDHEGLLGDQVGLRSEQSAKET
jgi:predicted amidohydrolase